MRFNCFAERCTLPWAVFAIFGFTWTAAAQVGSPPTLVPVQSAERSAQAEPRAPVPTTTAVPPRTDRSATDRTVDLERQRRFAQLAELARAVELQGEVVRFAAELVRPSVVHIVADKRYDQIDAGGDSTSVAGGSSTNNEVIEEAGAGTIISLRSRDFVITNRHVIWNAPLEGVHIQLANGRVIHPVRRWGDPETDIAVLEIEEPELVPARLGDSRRVDVGDTVLAFGSPFGLCHSVTQGIISAKGRRDLILGEEDVRLQDFMQTDAAINPGNSGGPLVNLRGEVIGMNTAIASNSGGNEGIAFSIPINMVVKVAEQLIDNGKPIRGFLGVQLDPEFDALVALELGMNRFRGTRVTKVTDGSPAADAGIREGDIVLRFGETEVETDSHLVNLVGMRDVGDEVPVTLYRNGVEVTVKVAIRSREELKTR